MSQVVHMTPYEVYEVLHHAHLAPRSMGCTPHTLYTTAPAPFEYGGLAQPQQLVHRVGPQAWELELLDQPGGLAMVG